MFLGLLRAADPGILSSGSDGMLRSLQRLIRLPACGSSKLPSGDSRVIYMYWGVFLNGFKLNFRLGFKLRAHKGVELLRAGLGSYRNRYR